MANFSSGLRLTDLDDFIGPGLDCIKPVPKPAEGVPEPKNVSITLEDCLACSGCVTSAETVLITSQSTTQFKEAAAADGTTIVASVSPQARASLAAHFSMSIQEVAGKLSAFLRNSGASHVFDTSFSRDLSLLEMRAEFLARHRGHTAPLPMLSSACPGWVCYAEKTHGDFVLPYIATTKSPQQVMGTLVKRHLAQKLGLDPSSIFHVAVMPCFDKKLEASRKDFYDDITRSRDVDCVLSTGEVLEMIEETIGLDGFRELPPQPLSEEFSSVGPNGQLYGVRGGAGGYLEAVFIHAAKELYGRDLTPADLVYKDGRNSDFKELSLEVDGKVVLKFALAYGFRNIQNFLRKMKNGRNPKSKQGPLPYDFIEVMACPRACNNGGGQIRAPEGESPTDRLAKVEAAYASAAVREPAENPGVRALYNDWLGEPYSETAKQFLHTQYHAIEKMDNPLAIKW